MGVSEPLIQASLLGEAIENGSDRGLRRRRARAVRRGQPGRLPDARLHPRGAARRCGSTDVAPLRATPATSGTRCEQAGTRAGTASLTRKDGTTVEFGYVAGATVVAGMPRLRRPSALRREWLRATSTPARERARSSAAATNSRKSGAGRVGRDLNSGWNCDATNHGWSGSSTISTSRPSWNVPLIDEAAVDAAAGGRRCSPRSGGGGARRSPARRRRPRACASPRRARRPARRGASCRRDPRPPSARAAGRSPGYGVSGSISVEFAPSRPQTWRANSETATCMPRQMPRYGISSSRATRQARILPSQPREPKPPGTSTPSTPASSARASSSVMFSASTQRTCTRQPLWMPACLSASCTER